MLPPPPQTPRSPSPSMCTLVCTNIIHFSTFAYYVQWCMIINTTLFAQPCAQCVLHYLPHPWYVNIFVYMCTLLAFGSSGHHTSCYVPQLVLCFYGLMYVTRTFSILCFITCLPVSGNVFYRHVEKISTVTPECLQMAKRSAGLNGIIPTW